MKNFTKSFLVALISLLCSATANAYDFEVNGIYYNILFMDDLTVEVTRGDDKYTGDVVIPSTVTYKSRTLSVTGIGYRAFYDCSSLTSIEIGNSVTSIGDWAFYDCSSLTSIEIPNSVTSIGDWAFDGCSALESVYISDIAAWCNIDFEDFDSNPLYYAHHLYLNGEEVKDLVIPNSVTSIGNNAFRGCSGLTSVAIPNSVTSIGEEAFCGCSSLTSIEIGNSVTSIGRDAFYYCSSLTSVEIPNSVTSIEGGAFHGCSSLTSVKIGNSVTSIGACAFDGCASLTSIVIPNSVTSIGDVAFYGCSSLISVKIGNSVTSIGDWAFRDCSSLTNIEIPNSVTSIRLCAFSDCSSLTSVEIGNSVTSIGEYAFEGCSSLTSVEIGNSVTSIGEYAFSGCDSLTSIYMQGATPPTVGSNNFTKVQYLVTTLYVPNGSLAAYQSVEPWKNFWEIKEYDATGIDDIGADSVEIKFTGNGICVPDAVGEAVYVYNVNGAVAGKFSHYDGGEIPLDKGTYIIRIGERSVKVQL